MQRKRERALESLSACNSLCLCILATTQFCLLQTPCLVFMTLRLHAHACWIPTLTWRVTENRIEIRTRTSSPQVYAYANVFSCMQSLRVSV